MDVGRTRAAAEAEVVPVLSAGLPCGSRPASGRCALRVARVGGGRREGEVGGGTACQPGAACREPHLRCLHVSDRQGMQQTSALSTEALRRGEEPGGLGWEQRQRGEGGAGRERGREGGGGGGGEGRTPASGGEQA